MNTRNRTTPPKWYQPVAVAALLWNIMGVGAYVSQMTMDISSLPDAQQAFYESMPAWATAAFAIAVFAGTLGSIGLLVRKSWAHPALVLSCVGIIVQFSHSLLLGNSLVVFGASALVLPLITLTIGLALIGLAKLARKSGWI